MEKDKKNYFYLIIKRLFDIIISIIGLILTIPIYILIRICYICTGDFSSVIYSHIRVGKNGKLFKCGSMKDIKGDKSLENVFMELEDK